MWYADMQDYNQEHSALIVIAKKWKYFEFYSKNAVRESKFRLIEKAKNFG